VDKAFLEQKLVAEAGGRQRLVGFPAAGPSSPPVVSGTEASLWACRRQNRSSSSYR
jgi:hypothetical protein